jgi:diacylglycerol kinase
MKRPLYKSFSCAIRGFLVALKTERNFKIHIAGLVVAVAAGIYLGLSMVEWGLIIFALGFVLTSELLNTAVEKIGDETSGGKHSNIIKDCKDMSAAAVLIAAFTALVIGVIVLIIPIFQKVF